jgi:predicted aspartyl protease
MIKTICNDNTHCITVFDEHFMGVFHSPIDISPFIPGQLPDKSFIKFNTSAIWDTGASGTVITQEVVNELKLKQTGIEIVNTASETGIVAPSFGIELSFGTNLRLVIRRAVLGKTKSGIDCLIGMDVISMGDFSITNYESKPCMSFRIPSKHRIDYVINPHINSTE